MRFVFLIPEKVSPREKKLFRWLERRGSVLTRTALFRRKFIDPALYDAITYGGTLNLMRHAVVAQSLGADCVLATPRGYDCYGDFNIVDLPFIRWSDRRPEDICIVPDFCSHLVNEVQGRSIVYLQIPTHLTADFDYMSPNVTLWTDSPFMLERCQEVFVGKDIPIVPNVVDDVAFRFRPQSEREAGLIMAFPRKGPDFIAETRRCYEELGGKYWHFKLIDGVPLKELVKEMERPQAFLASAEVEGCALPPQECMSCGIVVVGKGARGANFAMQDRETAMLAETPALAAQALVDLEDSELRQGIAERATKFISRYYPNNEPREFWRGVLEGYGMEAKA